MTQDSNNGLSPIAIVGMSCRFPGAADVDQFWRNLRAGVESVSFFSDQELLDAGVDRATFGRADYVRAGAVIDNADMFAASFFGISPREADVMNPQHRIFLECAWEAIERAGYDPGRYSGRIGVFAGSGLNAYLLRNVYGNIGSLQAVDPYTITTGNDKDFVPTRTSYLLDLKGPSVAINTACSTSLVAVHMACLSLWSYESDMALAGGVTIQTPQREGYIYVPGGIRSADGHCRPFDAAAQGTTNGSGAGVVLLKRLEDALADGDHIHAVIRGSAIGNDGAAKVGFTAPSVDGQAETITAAHTLAGIDPATISYVEAHGTGTSLGDPIEVAALAQAMQRGSRRASSCAIGSVKSNLGHLDTAAGVAGLIKAALSLEHRELPPSLHFAAPNPRIDFAAGPFHVNAQLTAWQSSERLRAGVSSFGIGGTNAHVVVEEAPLPKSRSGATRPYALLPISARTESALASAATQLSDHLTNHPDAAIHDVAFTLQHGRKAFEHRRIVVARDAAEAAAALRANAESSVRAADACRVVFMFPGQGSQHVSMGATLRASEPLFREHLERGLSLLDPLLRLEIDLLLTGRSDESRFRQTELAQPALFLIEYAASQLLLSWGVKPFAMIGHSLGEYVAACLAGVFSFDDAVRLVAERGRLMQSMPPGKMLAVDLPESELSSLLGPGLSIAAVNAPGRCVVAGEAAAIASFSAQLQAAGRACANVQTSHAFHTPMMDAAARQFEAVVATCSLSRPRIPVISSLTGRELTAEQATDPAYWAQQLRQPVRFADGIAGLLAPQASVFLEVGPGRALSGFVQAHGNRDASRHSVFQTMAHPRQDTPSEWHLLHALGGVWSAGGAVDWTAFQDGRDGRRVILPTYPFERTRHWIDAPREVPARTTPRLSQGDAGRAPSAQWLSAPTWRRAPLPLGTTVSIADGSRVLIFRPSDGPLRAQADALASELRRRRCDVIVVDAGAAFRQGSDAYEIDPADRSHYDRLIGDIGSDGRLPQTILHGWAGEGETGSFYSLVFLAQALTAHDDQRPCLVTVLTHGQHQVSGDEPMVPGMALTRGPVHVLPLEYSQLRFRGIDVEAGTAAAALLAEVMRDGAERDIAIRGRYRWTPAIEPIEAGEAAPAIKTGGVYWITGGFGGVGQQLARHLVSRYGAKVALSGRHVPDPADAQGELDQIARDLRAHQDALGVRGIEDYDGLKAGLERLCTAHIVRTFERAGINAAAGGRTTRQALRDALALRPSFDRFLDFFIDTLVTDEVVSRDGEELRFTANRGSVGDPETLAASLIAAHPGFAPLIEFIGHCASHYPDALSGRMPAIEVLYPGGSSERMERMSRETTTHDDYGAYVQGIRDLVLRQAQGSTTPLRILEIGGGKGVLTGAIVPALAGIDVEYHFTDLGATFVADMERQVRSRGIDFVSCRKLDISRDPAAQGYTLSSYDVVIGADVVHATPRIEETLGHLRSLLRPGGVLALIEGARPRRWMDMIWGLAEGWWLFEDTGLRRQTPLIGHEAWEGCFERQGFEAARAFPFDAAERSRAGFGLVVGRRKSIAHASDDVLPLAVDVADRQAMAAARDHILARFGRLDGVIHAAGVDDRQAAGSYDRVGSAIGLRPKVEGLRVLDEVLRDTGIETLMLCSSLSAISAGIGDTSYCSANAYLDAYAQAQGGGSRRVISINWDRWRGVGQALPFEARHAKRSHAPLPGGMTPDDAIAAFDRLLSCDQLAQVIVSPMSFGPATAATAAEADDAIAVTPAQPGRSSSRGPLHVRPALSTAHAAPRTDVERALAGIFEDVLGIDGLGIHDDFAELGGDSLMAVRVVSRVRDLMGRELEVRALFDCPTVAELATRLEPARGAAASITPGPRDADAPLSLAQQRLWFLYRLEGPTATYNILAARRMQGALDLSALQASVDGLVARHEALRTTFDERDGIGYQIVHPAVPVEIARRSLVHLDAAARELELTRVREHEASRAFDLTRGPLFAVTLVQLAPDDHVVLMVMHHIISDGWSLGVLSDEMARLYAAATDGRTATLPPLPIQYRDYAWWQKSRDRASMDQRVARWREQLAGAPPVLDLHPGRPRPSVLSRNGRIVPVRLSPEVTARLKALARECDASMFMVLLAAFDVLLQRYSGRDDLLVGTQVANRDRRELESLVGFFINTIVIRTDLSGRPAFRQLIARVRESALASFGAQDTPFERIVDAIQPERSFSYNPIVQVMFLWQNAPMGSLELAGLTMSPVPMPRLASKFDLTLELVESERGIAGEIEYSTDLFSTAEVERMAAQLEALIDAATATPDSAIADLPLIGDEADSALESPPATIELGGSTVVEVFQAVARRTPDAIAVVHSTASLTYEALDRRSNQVAHQLLEAGVSSESRVGIFLPASIDALVAIIGALKAGCAYVPLDPSHPTDRIATMLRASGAGVVITAGQWLNRLPSGVASIVLDRDAARIGTQPTVAPNVRVLPSNLAYVLFTSGSTGVPKGVQVEHRNVLTLLGGLHQRVLAAGPQRQRIALMASLVFDASVQQIFMALCFGHTLHLTEEHTRLDTNALQTFFSEQEIDVSDGTPSLLAILLDAQVPADRTLALRHLLIGGEALPADRVSALHAQDPSGRIALTNIYGPAECCVDVCAYTAVRGEEYESGNVPIGTPLAGRRLLVLDRGGQAQPQGVTGEIVISGAGVGRGYIGDPAATARRFRPVLDGQRGYATGDLGRIDEAGRLQFLGRNDGQVKIRGYRIELGEIEVQLRALPGVRHAAVATRPASTGHLELVAYVVADSSTNLTSAILRDGLATALPPYMIPSHFVRLDALPLNSSGKLDRAALPAPDAATTLQGGAAHVGARSDKEQIVAEVWREVLGLDRVGVEDNYFAAGGDSIKALQIVARLRARGHTLQIKDFFTHPTIAELASLIGTAATAVAAPAMSRGVIPLTPIQRRFFDEHDGNYGHFGMPVLLALTDPPREQALRRALETVTARHEALRLRFTQRDGEWRQEYVPESPAMSFEVADLGDASDQDAAMAAHAGRTQASFDIGSGPLFKAILYRRRDGDRLLLAAHHLVMDGVSWRILLEELATAYVAARAGREPDLPPPSSSFQAFVTQVMYFAAGAAREERARWRFEASLPIREGGQGGVTRYRDLDRLTFSLDADHTRRLISAHQAYATRTPELLLAALGRAIRDQHGASRFAAMLEGHGRDLPAGDLDLSRTVGWFTSAYPAVFELSPGDDPGRDLRQIKETLRAIPHGGIGYGALRYLSPDGATAVGDAPRLSFNFLGEFGTAKADASPFRSARESIGPSMDPDARPPYELELVGVIVEGRLEIELLYSTRRFERTAMAALLERCQAQLSALVAHALTQYSIALTPSDLDYDGFDLAGLDRFLDELERRSAGAITPDNIEDIRRLTPLQEGMLFHALADEDSSAYHQQISYRVRGDLDARRIESAWNRLFERHEVLRTAFVADIADHPVQVVLKQRRIEVLTEDLSALSPDEQQARVEAHRAADRRRGFDLCRDVLTRVAILRVADDCHEIIWSHHHVLLDGWSLGILQRELQALVAAGDDDAGLPQAPHFGDYIRWLGSLDQRSSEAFWAGTLNGYDQVAAPPRTALASPPQRRGRHAFSLSRAVVDGLRRLASARGATLNSVIHALWGLVLARYNGVEDVVFGTAVSGRRPEIPGVEDMVGLFINTVPVRVRPSRQMTFAELLAQVQAHALDCEPHHACPLARIQASTPLRDRLIATHVTLENYPIQQVIAENRGPVRVEAAEFFEQTHYDFDMQLLPSADGLRVQAAFSEAVHDRSQVERIEAHLRAAVAAVLRDPDVKLCDIEMLSDDEQRGVASTRATGMRASFETLIEGFERQVALCPDAVAISSGGEQVSYAELDRRASAVARVLRARGVGPDVLVPLFLDRSPNLVVGILAVMKAGGAYVPIDLSYPAERISWMLQDCAAPVTLTERARRHELPLTKREMLCIEDALDGEAPAQDALPRAQVRADNLAYVIFTSGTTGRPKGVMITHENVTRLFAATDPHFHFNGTDAWTMFHSYAFDFSVWEIWGALLYGGRLVIVPFWISRSPDEFLALLGDEQVSVLNQTPSAFRLLTSVDGAATTSLALRTVIFGGEALDVENLRGWFEHRGYQQPELVNMYGITETTVHVTDRPLRPDVYDRRGSLIGEPIPDLDLHVFDGEMRPAPFGVAGELYVGGPGLARGYLKRPSLTAERFGPDPIGTAPGSRLYKSGDVARRLDEREVDYHGRADHQVQLHGFRIELGEIEAALRAHPAVADAHVEHRQDPGGRQELAAYFIPRASAPSALELREALKARLPEYMVPAHFIALKEFPLTVNGKLDRRALPAPDAQRTADAGAIELPRSDGEKALAAVWIEVLQIERVGIHDNYLALGGDSIKAIQIVSRLRRDGWKLAIRELFQAPTIAGVAPSLTRIVSEVTAPAVITEAPLTAIQSRFVREHVIEPNRFNQAVCFRAPHGFDADTVRAALAAIVRHHDGLRLRITHHGNRWIQSVADRDTPLAFDLVDLRDDTSGTGPEALVEQHTDRLHGALDLEHGPLLRAVLLRMADGDRLVIVVHHIAIDGVSWRILQEDFSTACRQIASGRAIELPRSDSYLRWAAATASYADSRRLLAELPFWTATAATRGTRLVPADAPADNCYRDTASQRLILSAERTAQLLRGANGAYRTTPEDLLLAALARALHRCYGAAQTLLQLEGHGREDIVDGVDTSHTIGWFTSIYPFALHLRHDRDIGYQIKAIKEDVRAVPHRGVGYGILRYLTSTARLDGRSLDTRPEISLNYLGHFDSAGAAGGGTFRVSAVGGAGGVSPLAARPCDLDISALVLGDDTIMEFQFNPSRIAAADVTQLRLAFEHELLAVLDHCTGKLQPELTPADLSYSALSLDDLDELFE